MGDDMNWSVGIEEGGYATGICDVEGLDGYFCGSMSRGYGVLGPIELFQTACRENDVRSTCNSISESSGCAYTSTGYGRLRLVAE